MGIKILHCADVHIGAPGGIKRFSARRKREVLQTFLSVVSLAGEKSADLLLIAGDLFDGHKVGEDILGEIAKAFSAFSGRVFISPGNHDYYGESTFWETAGFPENVTIFKKSAEVYEIPELGARIYGGAFDGVYRKSHILNEFTADDDFINIAVIHGDIGADTSYGPVLTEEIKESKMDYIALGHIHKRSEVLKEGNTHYAYCGCPEGQGFDELGEKGVYFGTVEKGKADLEFIPTSKRRFVEETIDISSAVRKADIPEIILRKITEKYGDEGHNWFYKIILAGECSLSFSSAEISLALENTLSYVKIKNKTKAPLGDLEKIAEENSVKGIFVRKMLERAAAGENVEEALKIGLAAFFEEVKFDED